MGEIKGASIGKNLEKVIFDLEINEEAWADSVALKLHYGRPSFLYLSYTVSEFYDESSDHILYVKRTGPCKDDFEIDLSKPGHYVWDRFFVNDEEYKDSLEDPEIAVLDYEIPKTEKEKLKEELKEAIEKQEFEKAGQLRDKINPK